MSRTGHSGVMVARRASEARYPVKGSLWEREATRSRLSTYAPVAAPAPLFTLSLSLGDGRSTGDDIADALEALAETLRGLPGGPIAPHARGRAFAADGADVGLWSVTA